MQRRTPFLHVVQSTVHNIGLYVRFSVMFIFSTLLLSGGCDGTPQGGGSTDDDLFPASVVDGAEEYDIIAAKSADGSDEWVFSIRSRGTLPTGLSFEWEFGDGGTDVGSLPRHVFSGVGVYVVSVLALDASGEVAFAASLPIEVVAGNQLPIADAGSDQIVDEYDPVVLYGGGSFDPDNEALTYRWIQTAGPVVTLFDATGPNARFVAPEVNGDRECVFQLNISDGLSSGHDTVRVTVLDSLRPAAGVSDPNVSDGPTVAADAGPDQNVKAGDLVTLDARKSSSSSGNPLNYQWVQMAGPGAALTVNNAALATFTAPNVVSTTSLAFEVVIRDGDVATADGVTIVVVPASVEVLPPNGDGCPNDPNKTSPGLCGCGTADVDTDNDGTPDCSDACPDDADKTAPLQCGCDLPENDGDGDGAPDCTDGCPNDANKTSAGVCGCGSSDKDSDGDGKADCNDACPADANKSAPGVCGCGRGDADADGDGTPDCNDGCPDDPSKVGPGACGCGKADADLDNDGIPDCNGLCTGGVDSDGDGTLDCNDACPNDNKKIAPGVCGCGAADRDDDNDGTANCKDSCPNDNTKTMPGACGCGVSDVDSDFDGTPDCTDACPNDDKKSTGAGVCGCGVTDADKDGDGVPNCIDGCPNDDKKSVPGLCGCGIADADADGDGTVDCNDGCPTDKNKTNAGACGCGNPDTDADGNGAADCLDPPPTTNCQTSSSPTWQGFTFPAKSGSFTVHFDATPGNANMDGLIGLSNGATNSFDDSAVTARFNTNGVIDVWNESASWYAADTVIVYQANKTYHFRLEVNVTQHTYSVYVTPPGASEKTAALNYAFRGSQSAVASLDSWSIWSSIGSHTVCGVTVGDCVADSDNDGVLDCNDKCPGAPDTDSDADGVPDCIDACPGFDDKQDSDGDGIPDGCESPVLSANVSTLNFGSTVSGKPFEVWNSGGGTVSYTISDNADWLSVSPTSGGSAGEHDAITATVNRDGLADGAYQGTITVTPNVGTAVSIFVSMTVGVSAAVPMTAASRTSGVAPLAVHFDATNAASGIVQPPLADGRRDFAVYHYEWNFGDNPSATWSTNGKSRNEAVGYVAAHVFENPGTYTVTLHVTAPDGQTFDYEQLINVQVFSGKTYYVSGSGSDTNNGLSTTTPFKTFNKGMSMVETNVRILFNRGDAFTTSSSANLNVAGPGIVGAYGNVGLPRPIIRRTGSNDLFRLGGRDWRIMDLELDGSSGVGEGVSGTNDVHKESLVMGVHIHGFDAGVLNTFFPQPIAHDHNFVVDCEINNMKSWAVFMGGSRMAFLGNNMHDINTHIIRLWHAPGSIVSNNHLRDSGSSHHVIKLHNNHVPLDGRYIIVSDNRLRSNAPWGVTVGPQDDSTSEVVRDVVIERNVIEPSNVMQIGFRISAQDATVRNNIGSSFVPWKFRMIYVALRGNEPPPDRARIYNNTAYRGDGGEVITCEIVHGADVQVFNNLASSPGGGPMTAFTGTAANSGNNVSSNNPHFVSTDLNSSDYLKPSANSTDLIDKGASVPVFDDQAGEARPVDGDGVSGAQYDIGAREYRP